jgi:hypothetical protein
LEFLHWSFRLHGAQDPPREEEDGWGRGAAALLQFLLQMCRHPDVVLKIQDEIDSVLGDLNEPLTRSELRKMTYLDQVSMDFVLW